MTKAFAAQQFGTPNHSLQTENWKNWPRFFSIKTGRWSRYTGNGGILLPGEGGEPTGWNPAALPPTKRNIAFIRTWWGCFVLSTVSRSMITRKPDFRCGWTSYATVRSLLSYSKLRPLIQEPDDTETKRHGLKPVLSRGRRGKSLAGCSTIGRHVWCR